MKKEFIPYKLALELKELGFDEPCLGNYKKTGGLHILHYGTCGSTKSDNFNILAPLYQQAFRWFREKYNLNSLIIDSKSYDWYFDINDMKIDDVISEVLYFKTYEEAELECLKKLIEIVKNK